MTPSQQWLARRGWEAFAFQREVWQAIGEGRSGMLHATTGSGKTYAVWLGILDALLRRHPPARGAEPLRAIWLTPMRALAADTTRAIAEPLRALAPEWTIRQRTGDTPPPDPGHFSWAGHLGPQMQQPVVDEIAKSSTTLVFTNVRSQAEIWYQLLLAARPEWAGEIALHHGSLDRGTREWVEQGLKEGTLRAVVATSSLDLGVDFLPVERVLQIGSAKGVARMMQRAGRSGHAPGRASRVTLVPTNTMEIIEAAAARRAAQAGRVEERESPDQPLDVLVQHIVTIALGGGFIADELFGEVRTAWAYRRLTREQFDWALAFCERGGDSLAAYPDYHRIALGDDGVYRVSDRAIGKRHRLGIGTIVSDASVQVKYMSGANLGTIEEGFIARLRQGDCFFFAGKLLEFIRVRDMAAYVWKATRKT